MATLPPVLTHLQDGDQHALGTAVGDELLDEEANTALFEDIRVQDFHCNALETEEARRKCLVAVRWSEENLAM